MSHAVRQWIKKFERRRQNYFSMVSSLYSLYESWHKKPHETDSSSAAGVLHQEWRCKKQSYPTELQSKYYCECKHFKIILFWAAAQTICALAMIFQTHLCWWNLQEFGSTWSLVQWCFVLLQVFWVFFLLRSYYSLIGDTDKEVLRLKTKVKAKIFFR